MRREKCLRATYALHPIPRMDQITKTVPFPWLVVTCPNLENPLCIRRVRPAAHPPALARSLAFSYARTCVRRLNGKGAQREKSVGKDQRKLTAVQILTEIGEVNQKCHSVCPCPASDQTRPDHEIWPGRTAGRLSSFKSAIAYAILQTAGPIRQFRLAAQSDPLAG